jgi:diadenosine tetraphosphatase ApaH/serine/threonine PP2A family protein phosphatase
VQQRVSARRVALLGGPYSNYLALEAVLADARARGAEAIYCLGDLGGFGPHPDRIFPLLDAARVACVQGNYDESVGRGLTDCGCGYSDPRDNHFARISYAYTVRRTSADHRRRLAALPPRLRLELGPWRVLLCHGSPRQINEFLWDSTTPDGLLERFCAAWETDVIAVTHTGLRWHRALPSGRHAVNVGVIGRPENDGNPAVRYALLTAEPDLRVEFCAVPYDHETLACEMEREGLPPEFAETIRTGWWTCCLESLPVKERARGRY